MRDVVDPLEPDVNMGWLELTGFGSGLLCVWLLIRQNIWNFPIGLVYSLVSVAVFLEQRLYADVLLSAYYLLMNGYGWWYWRRGGPRSESPDLRPSMTPVRTGVWLAGLVALGIAGMGWFFDTQTNADLPYWDSAITVMSFAAMWMTARKYLENWIVWVAVDMIATCVYAWKEIELYAALYAIYLGMAVMGWRAWRRTMMSTERSV